MSEPNGDDEGNGGGDEPRARDLAAQPAPEGHAHPLDPATMAKLASWFDLPSFDEVAEQQAAARSVSEERSATEKLLEARSNALANIDPAFMASLDGRRASGATLPQIPLRETRWERRMIALDETRIPPAMDENDYPEVHIPAPLLKDLKACTPQAQLRDLHRPDKDFYIRLEPAFEDAGDPEAPDLMAPIRETLEASYRVGVVPPAMIMMDAGIADLRTILAKPWSEAKRERARKREIELLGKDAGYSIVATEPEGGAP